MNTKFETLLIEAVKQIIPKVEAYRAKNVAKYNAESAGEHGGEYSIREKYKNRVRQVDIFLPTIRWFVETYYTDAPTKNQIE